jgi:hypothetical protein
MTANDAFRQTIQLSLVDGSPKAGSLTHDRNANGQTRWFVEGSKQDYHRWQERKVATRAGGA